MNTTIIFSRGFAIPDAEFANLVNPLAVSNLYRKGGRTQIGNEKGVSFSIQVARDETEGKRAKKSAKNNAEHYAKVRMANKEGYLPTVALFNLTEQTFPILRGKLGIPRKLTVGSSEVVQIAPLNTFDEIKEHDDGEIIVQAESLTPEELRKLNIEIGTADFGREGNRVSITEAISSKAEFTYKPFETPNGQPEKEMPAIGETGGVLI